MDIYICIYNNYVYLFRRNLKYINIFLTSKYYFVHNVIYKTLKEICIRSDLVPILILDQ